MMTAGLVQNISNEQFCRSIEKKAVNKWNYFRKTLLAINDFIILNVDKLILKICALYK